MLEQAKTAVGKINLATPQINASPKTRTVVNLDTWFWVAGSKREVTGSSAFDLVAIATFKDMKVDPGDGSGSFTCPWTTSPKAAKADCYHEYRRGSYRGTTQVDGHPAFAVKVTAVYGLRFEVGGKEVEIPGAPTTLDAPPATAGMRVNEVQSIVTGIS